MTSTWRTTSLPSLTSVSSARSSSFGSVSGFPVTRRQRSRLRPHSTPARRRLLAAEQERRRPALTATSQDGDTIDSGDDAAVAIWQPPRLQEHRTPFSKSSTMASTVPSFARSSTGTASKGGRKRGKPDRVINLEDTLIDAQHHVYELNTECPPVPLWADGTPRPGGSRVSEWIHFVIWGYNAESAGATANVVMLPPEMQEPAEYLGTRASLSKESFDVPLSRLSGPHNV